MLDGDSSSFDIFLVPSCFRVVFINKTTTLHHAISVLFTTTSMDGDTPIQEGSFPDKIAQAGSCQEARTKASTKRDGQTADWVHCRLYS
jgi:hypothetical protein